MHDFYGAMVEIRHSTHNKDDGQTSLTKLAAFARESGGTEALKAPTTLGRDAFTVVAACVGVPAAAGVGQRCQYKHKRQSKSKAGHDKRWKTGSY